MKRTIASLMTLTFAFGLSLVGCGDDTTSNPPPADLKIEDLGAKMADTFCGVAFSCCTPMELSVLFQDFPSNPKTEAECIPTLKTQFDSFIVNGLKDGVAAGRLKYDGAKAATCLDAIQNNCSVLDQDGPFMGPSCDTVFVGLVAEGGACAQSNECSVPNSYCVITGGAMLGKCHGPVNEGQSCMDAPCAAGLVCGYANMMNVCIKPIADGGACVSDTECVSEFCNFTTNVCGPKTALGGACMNSYECKDGYCEAQSKVCTALKADGQPCMFSDECQSNDCDSTTNTCAVKAVCDGI